MIVDRLEEDFAVCEKEDGSFVNIPLGQIAGAVREGDLLVSLEQGGYQVDEAATKARRENMSKRQRSIFE